MREEGKCRGSERTSGCVVCVVRGGRGGVSGTHVGGGRGRRCSSFRRLCL